MSGAGLRKSGAAWADPQRPPGRSSHGSWTSSNGCWRLPMNADDDAQDEALPSLDAQDEAFLSWLVEYDEALAAGQPPPPVPQALTDSFFAERLRRAQICLQH